MLRDLLRDAEQSKTSLEGRATAIVSLSGVLITLLLGLIALGAPVGKLSSFPRAAVGTLSTSLVLMVVASAAALLVHIPLAYQDVSEEEMERLTEKNYWDYSDRAEGARMVAKARTKALGVARGRLKWKGWLLGIAIVAEVAGMGFLAATLWSVLPR